MGLRKARSDLHDLVCCLPDIRYSLRHGSKGFAIRKEFTPCCGTNIGAYVMDRLPDIVYPVWQSPCLINYPSYGQCFHQHLVAKPLMQRHRCQHVRFDAS